jgi:uncharacterized SAM-binding protein YcdF (DUF218 family)
MRIASPAILNAQAQCLVIMGAAVKPGGAPSGAMQRRVRSALILGQASISSYYLVTGGKGKFDPPESELMKAMLQDAGISADHIISEANSDDTLSSVIECAALLRSRSYLCPIVVCTDTYHIARCRLLFHLLGIATEKQPMQSGRQANGLLRWTYYYLRESLAIPWDALLLISRKFLKLL